MNGNDFNSKVYGILNCHSLGGIFLIHNERFHWNLARNFRSYCENPTSYIKNINCQIPFFFWLDPKNKLQNFLIYSFSMKPYNSKFYVYNNISNYILYHVWESFHHAVCWMVVCSISILSIYDISHEDHSDHYISWHVPISL